MAIIVGAGAAIFFGYIAFWLAAHMIPWKVDELVIDERHSVVLYGTSNLDLNYDMYYKVFRDSRKIFQSESFFCKHVYGDSAEDYLFYSTKSGVIGIYSSASPDELVGIMDLVSNRFPSRPDQTLADELLAELNRGRKTALKLDDFHFSWQFDSK